MDMKTADAGFSSTFPFPGSIQNYQCRYDLFRNYVWFWKKDFKEIEVFSTTATLLGFLVCLSFCLLEDCQFLNYTG